MASSLDQLNTEQLKVLSDAITQRTLKSFNSVRQTKITPKITFEEVLNIFASSGQSEHLVEYLLSSQDKEKWPIYKI